MAVYARDIKGIALSSPGPGYLDLTRLISPRFADLISSVPFS